MIRRIFGYLTLLVICLTTQSALADVMDTTKVLQPSIEHSRQAKIMSGILKHFHYKKAELNDTVSSHVLDTYLRNLDMNRMYFLKSDVEAYEAYRYDFDDALRNGELEVGYDMYAKFKERFQDRMAYADKLFKSDFDFTTKEYYDSDRENAPWAETTEELNEFWRKMIKSQLLSLKLGDKTLDEAKKTLKDRYSRLEKTVMQQNSEDVFQLFMNAYSEVYDPHTAYFSPITSENFKISMSKSLEGIGARLQTENDYTIVYEVIPGGPAYTSKKIHKNDKIIGVGQGVDGEIVDVFGWRIDEVVDKIRGPKGTTVRLQIMPAGAPEGSAPEVVILERDRVELEDQRAEKAVFPMEKDGKTYKVGVITIPSFYLDFDAVRNGEEDYASTTRDVKKLLIELEKEGIDALMIDLRYNGGGSLTEAIDLTGLFIPEGPVVQIKNTTGQVEVKADVDPSVVYDGPLTVLVNRFSASASEIFSGAIQDYKRGVVLGEQTYGKGTVQNVLSLNRFLPGEEKELGQYKLTLAKFYRVSGSSTQHKGVTPDVLLPSAFSAEEFGESSQPTALKWDQINPTYYSTLDAVNEQMVNRLRKLHEERMTSERPLIELQAEIKEMKEARNDHLISLVETERIKEREEEEKRMALMTSQLDNAEVSADEVSDASVAQNAKGSNSNSKLDKDAYLLEGVFLSIELAKLWK
jgi:carboxyl-terminal processing protease